MTTVMSKPNLFLVGAPKCGTTALYSYLRRHPEVFMSAVKEPQFFAVDIFAAQRNVRTLSDYLNCFAGANGHKRIGEASTAYLGSGTAAQEINAFSPSAKIIIMLRNPVDVMYAEHSERVFSNMEHIRNFEIAVASSEKRKWHAGAYKGEEVFALGYRELSLFAQAVKKYFDVFGRENVHVIVFDDFRNNPASVFAEVLHFLEVGPAPQIEYSVTNANRRARSTAVQDLIRHPPKRMRGIARTILSRRVRSAIGRFVQNLNIVYAPRPPMGEQLRTRLQRECRPDIEELSCLLRRDLTHWCGSHISEAHENGHSGSRHTPAPKHYETL
jgi:hypothetical protein